MGFFFEEAEKPVVVKGNASTIKKQIGAGGIGCDNCFLRAAWPRLLTPRMPTLAPAGADILVLGASPSIEQDLNGSAALDKKNMLAEAIPSHEKDRIAYQNVTRCAPDPASADLAEAHACSPYLIQDIEKGNYKAILGVGSLPLKHFMTGGQIHEVHGLRFPVQIGSKNLWYYPVMSPEYVNEDKPEWGDSFRFPVFKADVKNFFKRVDGWNAPVVHSIKPKDVLIAHTLEEARNMRDAMQGVLGSDIETNALRPMINDAKIITASLSDGDLTMAWAVDHHEQHNEWGLQFLIETMLNRPWVAHNASFELLWFTYWAEKLGMSTDFAHFDDSMALARLYFERESVLDLGSVSAVILGTNIKSVSNLVTKRIMEYPLSEVLPYNGIDAWASARVLKKIGGAVDQTNYQRILDSVRTTSYMELQGLNVDQEEAAKLKDEWEGKLLEWETKIAGIYEVKAFERDRGKTFNVASPDDLGHALATYGKVKLPRTKTGYKTDDAAIQKSCPDHPLALAALAHRNATRTLSTYVRPMQLASTIYIDQMLHPSYTTMLTATGRLSSFDPNIQNFPKRKHHELRRPVVAPPGMIFVAFDYGQLEARVIAMISKDRNLCHSIIVGRDIHTDWLNNCLEIHPEYLIRLAEMTNIVGAEEKKIRKKGRDIIKTDFVFAGFFGSSAKSISERTKIPLPLVEELHRDFWKEFKGVGDWIKGRRNFYRDTGSAMTLTGRVRHSPLGGNEPINTPVQGTAADIVVDGMNALAKLSRELGEPCLHPRINIHDDLIFCLPDNNDLDKYISTIQETMVEIRYPWQVVPLMVEGRVGTNWAELEEFTTYTGEYVR